MIENRFPRARVLACLLVLASAGSLAQPLTWTPPPPGMMKLPPREGARILPRPQPPAPAVPPKAQMVNVLPPLAQQPPPPPFVWPDCSKGCVSP